MKRMSNKPLVSIFTTAMVLFCSACFGQDLPSADDVIAHYTKAIGGSDALAKFKSASKEGTIVFTNGGEGEISILQDSGKYLMEVVLDGGDVRRGSDGKVVWEIHPSLGARLIDGKLKKTYDNNYGRLFPSLSWNKDGFKGEISCTGIEEIEGKANCKVVFKPTDGFEAVRYFDKKTGLLTKLETSQEFPQFGEVDIVAVYSNYEASDGISMPMSQTYSLMATSPTRSSTAT